MHDQNDTSSQKEKETFDGRIRENRVENKSQGTTNVANLSYYTNFRITLQKLPKFNDDLQQHYVRNKNSHSKKKEVVNFTKNQWKSFES